MTTLSPYQKVMITILVMLATILQVIDTTIANVSLPHIQSSLSATQDQVSWVLTSYIVSSAIMTAPIGWLSNQFGTKKIFLASVAGFTIASALTGMAQSINEIVFARLLQGVFGAALVPLSQAVLFHINPPEKHGQAMALWGVGVMVGPIIGPTLGGYITEYYSWRWVFYVNVPIGILTFLGMIIFLYDTEIKKMKFDFIGFGLLSAAIACTQLILDRGERVDWFGSSEIITYAVILVISLWWLILHTIYAQNSFINITMFKDRNFISGIILIFGIGTILMSSNLLLPPLLQNLLGYPVIDTGLLMVPRGAGTMAAMLVVGQLINKTGAKPLILTGILLMAESLREMMEFSLIMSAFPVIWSGIIQGFGLGLVFAPLSTITFSTLPPEQRTEATGFFSLLRNIGGSIGISVVNVILANEVQINHSILSEYITPFNRNLDYLPKTLFNGYSKQIEFAYADYIIQMQANFIAFINDFKFMMIVVLCSLPMVFLLRHPRIGKENQEAHVVMGE